MYEIKKKDLNPNSSVSASSAQTAQRDLPGEINTLVFVAVLMEDAVILVIQSKAAEQLLHGLCCAQGQDDACNLSSAAGMDKMSMRSQTCGGLIYNSSKTR